MAKSMPLLLQCNHHSVLVRSILLFLETIGYIMGSKKVVPSIVSEMICERIPLTINSPRNPRGEG